MTKEELEIIVAAILTAGSFVNTGTFRNRSVVNRYRLVLEELRGAGGPINPRERKR